MRVGDILEFTERALSHVEGLDFEHFSADPRSIDAVRFAIVAIGEAASHIPESVVCAAPEIPWSDIRDMRKRITHEYFGIDLGVLWQTVVADLPQLRHAFRSLLERKYLS